MPYGSQLSLIWVTSVTYAKANFTVFSTLYSPQTTHHITESLYQNTMNRLFPMSRITSTEARSSRIITVRSE